MEPFPATPLLLTGVPADYSGPSIVKSNAALTTKIPEQAGRALLRLLLARIAAENAKNGTTQQKHHHAKREESAGDAEDESDSDYDSDDEDAAAEALRLRITLGEENHYSTLGLDSATASDEDIRKAYRRLILVHHPDKVGGSGDAAADPVFLAIQKAYDTLSDDNRKKIYDSTLDFDEAIPSGNETLKNDDAFYALYGPVFARNARFSVKKPVPVLGDGNSTDAQVEAFYKFWFAFDSWRDFSGEGEHKPDNAEYREEKRWMERENAKAATKKKKTEMSRLADLVNRANARDPRVIRVKKAEEAAKQAARDAKINAKKAAEDAKVREAAEKIAAAQAAEEAAKSEAMAKKNAKEREKKAGKRAEKEIRKLLAEAVTLTKGSSESFTPPTDVEIEMFVSSKDAAGLCATLLAAGPYAGEGFYRVAGSGDATPSADGGSSTPGFGTPTAGGGGGFGASNPFVVMLITLHEGNAAAVGAQLAWSVAEAVAIKKGTPRPVQSPPPAPVAPVAVAPIVTKVEHPWSVLEQSLLAKAGAKFPPGTRNRWVVIADYINVSGKNEILRTPDECIAKAKAVGEDDRKAAGAAAFSTYQAQLAAKGKDVGPGHLVDTDAPAGGVATLEATPVEAAAPSAAAPKKGASPAASAVDPEMGVWSSEDQKLFEEALRTFPASLDKAERWTKVSAAVPGKTKKQCVARFKFLREQVLATNPKQPA